MKNRIRSSAALKLNAAASVFSKTSGSAQRSRSARGQMETHILKIEGSVYFHFSASAQATGAGGPKIITQTINVS